MQFPNLVYKCPGTHQCPGGTFDATQVNDEGQLSELIKDGWKPTLACAQNPADFDVEKFIADQCQPDLDLSTLPREELEGKARSLGITFNRTFKDETLISRITHALAAGGQGCELD